MDYKGKTYHFVLYGRQYEYKCGPYTCKGTAFYLDKERTQLHSRDPYKAMRKTQVINLNYSRYLVIMN